MSRFGTLFFTLFLLCVVFVPLHQTFAHEVYVLDHATVVRDVASQSPNPFGAFWANQYAFFFWGFICLTVVLTVFFAGVFHVFESWIDPILYRLKRYASLVARLTLGVCLIAGASYGALFGPELPLTGLVAFSFVQPVTILLYVIGVCVTLGIYTRLAGAVALGIYLFAVTQYGWYILTYTNYLGEILIVLLLGGGAYSIDYRYQKRKGKSRTEDTLHAYAFPILRICFGLSVVFAAYYAKFLHSNLALDTVTRFNLTNYFHFEPLFVVLGALVIELLLGVFFIIGIEIRWASLFFLFWLGLSLWYFGESVWPHLVLLGVNVALFLHGYDKYTLEGKFFKIGAREPVL